MQDEESYLSLKLELDHKTRNRGVIGEVVKAGATRQSFECKTLQRNGFDLDCVWGQKEIPLADGGLKGFHSDETLLSVQRVVLQTRRGEMNLSSQESTTQKFDGERARSTAPSDPDGTGS